MTSDYNVRLVQQQPTAPVILEQQPTAPVMRVDGRPVVHLSDGRAYQVSRTANQLVALPYSPRQEFDLDKKIAMIASSSFGIGVGAVIGLLAVTPVGWAILIGCAVAAAVTGIALAIIHARSQASAPEMLWSRREYELEHHIISDKSTRKEQRHMFFTKTYLGNKNQFIKDLKTLIKSGAATEAEIAFLEEYNFIEEKNFQLDRDSDNDYNDHIQSSRQYYTEREERIHYNERKRVLNVLSRDPIGEFRKKFKEEMAATSIDSNVSVQDTEAIMECIDPPQGL